MKKIILSFIILISLTGCDPNHDFEKVCTKEVKSNDYKENVKTVINYNNKDEVTKVEIIKKYQTKDTDILSSVKESTENFNDSLKSKKSVNVKVSEDKNIYEVTYTLIPKDMNDITLENFGVKKNSIKYFNYLKKSGAKCS